MARNSHEKKKKVVKVLNLAEILIHLKRFIYCEKEEFVVVFFNTTTNL